jgi:hypothetical protein
MKRLKVVVFSASLAFTANASAQFFELLKDVVEDTAKTTLIMLASDMVRDMIVEVWTEQTATEEEVAEEYEKENGSLPASMMVSSYETMIFPGESIEPGQEVRVKSVIEVVPGQDGKEAKIEETLTIWDNEDNEKALKSMTKEAGDSGGIFEGEFSFTLPEGMPQGVYPISVDLTMDGEWVKSGKYDLQLVMMELPTGEMVARLQ